MQELPDTLEQFPSGQGDVFFTMDVTSMGMTSWVGIAKAEVNSRFRV